MNKNSATALRKNATKLPKGEGNRKSGPVMGVDASKSILSCAIVTDTEILFERNFNNTKQGIAKILRVVDKYQVETTAFEATSTYHFKLMFAMIEAEQDILLANPQQTKNTQGKKTDKFDARRIAVAHRDGRLLPSVISPKATMELRRSTRTLQQLKSEQTKCKQRLQQIFHQHDFTLKRDEKNLLKSKWSLQLLHEISSKKHSHKMIEQLVFDLLPGLKTGTKSLSDPRVQTIIKKLSEFDQSLSELDRITMYTQISQLRLQTNLIQLQRQVYLKIANDNIEFYKQLEVLLSIPGIGPDTASTVLAEIVDISLFASAGKLVKWSGLAPKVQQSGHRKRITGKIHKGGNKYVRRALTTACQYIYARGNVSHPIYQFIKSQFDKHGIYWKAICAGARKLACIIWTLLTKHERWQPPALNDKKVIHDLHVKIDKKIKALEHSIRRYKKVKENLAHIVKQDLNIQYLGPKNPNRALKVLLDVS